MNLLEAYKQRIQYAEKRNGAPLSTQKKVALATVLNTTNKFLNEAFANSVGTQQTNMGAYKKFCLNLTNVVLPNLIAFDLVIVKPMTSYSGSIAFVKYVAGSNKGQTKQGDLLNSPFALGKVDPEYTSEAVTETVTDNSAVTLAWTPIVKNAFGPNQDVKFISADGQVSYLQETDGKVTPTGAGKIAYRYDNVVIPQNDLPIVNAVMDSISLQAKARRVAIYYSQIAAFQAKTDYGFDLGDQLAQKAVGQLQWEIDTEITDLLVATAGTPDADLTFNKALPLGVSKRDHYEAFVEIIEKAKAIIYKRTQRFTANYMIIAADILPILSFIPSFKATGEMPNGPYLAGTLNGLKVYVKPNMAEGTFALGLNGDDLESSVAVFAPYMAVVPTQLLGYADGGMSQGWSTLYDLQVLNANLIVAGKVIDEPTKVEVTTE